MSLQPVNLDDRDFDALLETALSRVSQRAPSWTNLSPGDPGMVMLDAFAHLTDVMLYRLNRLPEKVYVECLRLLGVQRRPATAAHTQLTFELREPLTSDVEIPQNTRVAARREGSTGPTPVFSTIKSVLLKAGETAVSVKALHCHWHQGELLGTSDGSSGQTFQLANGPVICHSGDGLDLVVAIESEKETGLNAESLSFEGKRFEVWSDADNFIDAGRLRRVYLADRQAGVIRFGPVADDNDQAHGLAPANGTEIRAWYRSGGGLTGNVAAGVVSELLDPIPGVSLEVSNAKPATGGRDAEPLERTYERGPQSLHSLNRAVTAEDFRQIALRSSGTLNRAFAYNKHAHWAYAAPGSVEVVCVPHVPSSSIGDGPLTPEILGDHASDDALMQVDRELASRRPLGTRSEARWGKFKSVRVATKVVAHAEADRDAVKKSILKKLYATINPLYRDSEHRGWAFGQPLTTYDVYRLLVSEPGVKYVEPVRLCVDAVPAKSVTALSADGFQAGTWYSAAGDGVFRSLNDGDSWERIARIDGSVIRKLLPYPREAAGSRNRAGLIAAIAEFDGDRSRIFVSRDCGEQWEEIGSRPQFTIESLAWKDANDGTPALLLATAKGLYELSLKPDATPDAVLVDQQRMGLGFWSVAVSTDVWGRTCVAVAARDRRGVYLSEDDGKPGTFRNIGLEDQEVRVLRVQHDGATRALWAGREAVGDDPGIGCASWQLPKSPDGWVEHGQQWHAGGCLSLTFDEGRTMVGTRRHGVLSLVRSDSNAEWSLPDVQSGLPMQSLDRMASVDHVASRRDERRHVLMAAGPEGIYRSVNGSSFECCSEGEFSERVMLPPTWLLCSDEHDIEVMSDADRTD